MCFASVLATPTIQSNVEKIKSTIYSIVKKRSQNFCITPASGPLAISG